MESTDRQDVTVHNVAATLVDHKQQFTLRLPVLGLPCYVKVSVFETHNLITGEQSESIVVDEIITEGTGQTLFTRQLNLLQFKDLIAAVRERRRQAGL